MVSASSAEPRHADGVAIFTAAAFLLGLGVIATLERAGAPEALVQALGPLFALLALAIIGILTRAPSLIDFLAARRSAPPLYGGLAFAATAAGMSGALAAGSSPVAWRAFAMGLAVAALIVAPDVRAAKVSALSDVLATAFPWRPARAAFAVLVFAMGLATAISGFGLAVDTLVAGMGASRSVSEALVALALALSLAPGGLKGLLWSDAACAGGALLIAGAGAAPRGARRARAPRAARGRPRLRARPRRRGFIDFRRGCSRPGGRGLLRADAGRDRRAHCRPIAAAPASRVSPAPRSGSRSPASRFPISPRCRTDPREPPPA